MTYVERVWAHMESILSGIDDSRVDRKLYGKSQKRHGHVIVIKKGEDRLELIKRINLLVDNEGNKFSLLIGKAHKDAHHMNSSQIMCYNFFGYLLKDSPAVYDKELDRYFCKATPLIISFCKKELGIEISDNAKCVFEFVDTSCPGFKDRNGKVANENSNFDFYIEDSRKRLFFEIKYTESDFGKWKKDSKTSENAKQNHDSYFNTGYASMIKASPIVKKKETLINTKDDFNKYYQLFRNALRANDSNSFSIVIYPKANKLVDSDFRKFVNSQYISMPEGKCVPYKNKNFIRLYWEDIDRKYKDDSFISKYLDIE